MRKRQATPDVSRKDRHERRVVALLSDRDLLMNEIALRARIETLPPMLAKARTLLTRFWAKGSWETRAELLSAARLLLTLGAAQPALRPAGRNGAPIDGGKSPAPRRRKPGPARGKISEMS